MTFSKTDHAYETLRRKILDGRLKPGDRLRLFHLAAELELSEMPVREALRLLQSDGLVVINLHRGAEVAQLSFEQSWNIEEVRLRLEADACLSAAPYHDEASCRRLDRYIEAMRKESAKPAALARANRDFHTELMSRAPNPFLREHVQELWDRAWQLSSTSFFEFMPQRIARLPAEGELIVDCLRARDLDRLDRVLRDRLRELTTAWRAAAETFARRASHDLAPAVSRSSRVGARTPVTKSKRTRAS